jgi:hypothetical protein
MLAKVNRLRFVCVTRRERLRADDAANAATLDIPKERGPAPLVTHLLRNSRGSAYSKKGQKESIKKEEKHIHMHGT